MIVKYKLLTFRAILSGLIHCTCFVSVRQKKKYLIVFLHWSSLIQVNLKPTRPNSLMGCKAPTDLVIISVKEPSYNNSNGDIILQCCS